ncbi:MAG: glutathione S-transferase family protein, partial [Sneathiella sp.]|nr:glutathione S-transferase family protein [Sneathiella sp.]
FSIKVRSYFRYKNIEHKWRPRTQENFADFKAHAKLPLIPLIICPDGSVLQDSSPIIEKMEMQFPDHSVYPEGVTCDFLSTLLEEYGDEWVNKPMFHYRWWADVDQIAVAAGLAQSLMPNGTDDGQKTLAEEIRERMVPRLSFVGSCDQNKHTIETSLDDLLRLMEKHLVTRPYIFGGKPSFGDFGLIGQIYGCTQQPTTASMIESKPHVATWVKRMLNPEDLGAWETWEVLSPTLHPLIKSQVGELYMPWAMENWKSLETEHKTFTVALKGSDFTQNSMKYTGRSFAVLRAKFEKLENRGELEDVLLAADCLRPLVAESW